MAGHSKWANTKHRKARSDNRRGKIFSRIIKELLSAAKEGTNPDSNFKLRAVLEKAKMANIPKETIERNLKKSKTHKANFEEVSYEFYGYGGVAIIINSLTDNKNRTIADLRTILHKRGLKLAPTQSLSYLFDTKVFFCLKTKVDKNAIFDSAVEWGAIDVDLENMVITADLQAFSTIEKGLKNKNWLFEYSIEKIPQLLIECSAEDSAKNGELIEALEGLDDIDAIAHQMKL